MCHLLAIALVLACANCCLAAPSIQELQSDHFDLSKGKELDDQLASGGQNVLIDPSKLMGAATPVEPAELGDIEEDPKDRFITTRSGKRRPVLMESPEAGEWAEEMPSPKVQRVLSRVKRCGGGNDDDANRARRARRARRNRANRARRAQRRAAKRASKSSSSTTTTKRTVIQNGQVVSKTVESTGPVVQSVATVPVVVQHHHQQPAATTTTTHQVVQQPAPVVVAAAAPAPVAAPVAVAPVAGQVAAPAVPSVAVQGSVKIN